MYTEFHIKANELDEAFIQVVRSMFKSKRISIVIEEEQDETTYLLKSKANKKMLLDSIKQDQKGKTINFDLASQKKK